MMIQHVLYIVVIITIIFGGLATYLFGWAILDRIRRIKKIRKDEWALLPVAVFLWASSVLLVILDLSGIAGEFYGRSY